MKLIKLPKLSPIQIVVLSFLFLITSGTLLLLLPISTVRGISPVDALFTSTSAVCVTGLVVLDTAKDFTFFGQVVIILLIQFGGLGIMTFSIALLSFFGGSYSIKWRFTLQSFYNEGTRLNIRSILKRIVLYTFILELISAAILFTRFIQFFPVKEALWHSIFHSVSAFCNAGFSTFSENLAGYKSDPVVILTISGTVILGGIGFLVLSELAKTRFKPHKAFFMQYSLHTRIVLIVTGILLISGTAWILILEWHYALKDLTTMDKILNSFFQSMTCRTAGFNTMDIGSLRESTLFSMVALMFIGGSPGSIAGGIKTTTIAVVFGILFTKFSGKKQIVLWGRALDHSVIDKSTTLIMLSGFFIYLSTFLLLFIHSFDIDHSLLSVLFEVTSAFGTVGLSTGITPSVHSEGKVILSMVMLVGRLGPLALITALTSNKKNILIEYPEESIMIG